ncbi:hypothetical protein LPJ73_005397 [Coemansia sp. RSA 2703]|nr:hypothetical protein LPJ73_005397 [Coemansia sp. RSA 2703]KAJ2371999.1 hypothetical protein IW150_004336 [Coemansia sp. RSA 2607]
MFNIKESNLGTGEGSPSSAAAEQFLTSSSGILAAMCGNAGASAQLASRELVEVMESMEHTSSEQFSATGDLLKRLQGRLESSKEKLETNGQLIEQCCESRSAAAKAMAETLDGIKRATQTDDTTEARRAEYRAGTDARNQDFEARLRSEHQEFLRMHAQRLAKVIGKSQF